MSRRKRVLKRPKISPDPVYGSVLVSRLINKIMYDGKKTVAESVIYQVMDIIKEKVGEPLEVLEKAIENVAPEVEVRSRRVGGANYQVPVEVRQERRISLALRWLIQMARERKEKGIAFKLANEIIDAYNKIGNAYKKKIDTHKMAEANRAFAHLKW